MYVSLCLMYYVCDRCCRFCLNPLGMPIRFSDGRDKERQRDKERPEGEGREGNVCVCVCVCVCTCVCVCVAHIGRTPPTTKHNRTHAFKTRTHAPPTKNHNTHAKQAYRDHRHTHPNTAIQIYSR